MILHQRLLSFFLLTAIILYACAPAVKPPPSAHDRRDIETARTLMTAGDYSGAEQIYRRLANKSASPEKEHYLLLAAEALLQLGDNLAVKELLYPINARRLAQRDFQRYYLIAAQAELNIGHPEQALDKLDSIQTDTLSPHQKQQYYRQRASAYAQMENWLDSARQYVILSEELTNPKALESNSATILQTLAHIPDAQLIGQQPPPPDKLGGWMALTYLLKRFPPNSPGFQQRQAEWRATYPDHPAASVSMQPFLQKYHPALHAPKALAVLLPQSGPYSGAAEAVREGIMAAYRRDARSARPSIRFYDSQSGHPYELYQQAVAEGAGFVIGPLEKNTLRTLAEGGPLTVPVLALNQVSDLQKRNLVLFGLNPNDEVAQAASTAWFDGHHAALVLIPDSSFGARMADSFYTKWRQLGGTVLETERYNPKETDFSAPIKRLINVDDTGQYTDSDMGSVSAPRMRQDADFIFLVARSQQGRLLRPQLDINGAEGLPVYATSLIYDGRPDSATDQGLEGVIFCDMPFMFANQLRDKLPKDLLALANSSWQTYPGPYLRLIALGIDAYRLAIQMSILVAASNDPFAGATGTLSLSKGDQIQRQLYCAQFAQGIPYVRGKGLQLPGGSTP